MTSKPSRKKLTITIDRHLLEYFRNNTNFSMLLNEVLIDLKMIRENPFMIEDITYKTPNGDKRIISIKAIRDYMNYLKEVGATFE